MWTAYIGGYSRAEAEQFLLTFINKPLNINSVEETCRLDALSDKVIDVIIERRLGHKPATEKNINVD